MGEVAASEIVDLLVIGAGPTGLACAIEAQRAGFTALLVDKGCLCNSLFHYPANMTFFTTPELLEIGNMPFSSPNQKPNRNEALEYYRKVAEHYELDIRQYENVERVDGSDGNFTVHTMDRFGRMLHHRARKLVVATGYYDLPNYLGIPGEDLSKVKHYYHEPHPFYGLDVLVIGGKNSAAIAALDLWRHGAKVTLVHRGAEMHRHVKYWILPDINNRIKERRDQGLLQQQRHQHRRGRRNPLHAEGRGDAAKSVCLRADRLSSGLQLHREPRRDAGRSERPLPGLRSRDAREQRPGNLSRRGHRRGRAHQRNLHRERPLPRPADRRGPAKNKLVAAQLVSL